MKLTKEKHKELDSCKQVILRTESLIEKAEIALDLYIDTENTKEYTKALDMIDFGSKKIRNIINAQSLSLNIPYNVCVDLIFDREHTLEMLNR